MKFVFDDEEKKFISYHLEQMGLQAAQLGDRALYKNLIRVANRFKPNSTVSEIKNHEVGIILDFANGTLETLKTSILPKVESSDKPEQDKKRAIENVHRAIETASKVIDKLSEKL